MKKTAFKNMTSKVELVRRIERTEAGVNILSVGGQIKHVLPFLSSKPMLTEGYQVIEVELEFANKLTGVDYVTKYINIKDNLFDGDVCIDDANTIRQLRCYGEDYIDDSKPLTREQEEERIDSMTYNVFLSKDTNIQYTEVNDKQNEFNNELAHLLVSAFEEINNPDIKHTTFDENTTDEELCNTLDIDIEEFKARRTGQEEMTRIPRCRVGTFNDFDGILGVNPIEDYNDSTGVLISSDSFINKLKSRGINNDAGTSEACNKYNEFIAKFDSMNKDQVKRKTEKELIKELDDKFVCDSLAISMSFEKEVINFNQYSDMILKAVKDYNDTKESHEYKKELIRARMYDKFFSSAENLR